MTVRSSAPVVRKGKVELLEDLKDDLDDLIQRVRRDARSHSEAEARVNEAERISSAIRRLFRG